MKQVLWISRHEMTPAQFADLERAMDSQIRLLPWKDSVRDMRELAPLVKASDAVAAVLPPELLGELLKLAGGKPVLRAISGREPTGRTLTLADGRTEPEFAFVHCGWEQILVAEFSARRL